MFLTLYALRRPLTILVACLAIALTAGLAVGRSVFDQLGWKYPAGLPRGMDVDIFPALNLPVIYVCQPYGGMDPAQMEGYLTNYYEYHFLYITGIHHVESRSIQGTALMKLFFHPGTNMAQAMAETINYVNRSQAFMPPGTVSPFVMRFDTGSVPVGYLVLSSETRSIAEIQDLALFRVRPMFASLPGVSAPPPFGGAQRTVVVTVDPERLQAYGMSPEEVVTALTKGNTLSPSGNVPVGDEYPIVPVNSVVRDIRDLETIPVRLPKDSGGSGAVYIRDIGTVRDSMDAPSGYALANGRRAVYILATKRADASTLSVVNAVKRAIPDMQAVLPSDIKVSFELDQSPYVTQAVSSVVLEGILGAGLVGLMILLFLRDWRSVVVVVLNIPLALLAAIVALWISGQTINLMTLGGLALAIGILVDEATVEIENIHALMEQGQPVSRAVLNGSLRTNTPRLLAMLSILAVFVSSFFMPGAAQALFVPLSLAVGFSMLASYLLSSTFVPVLCVWLLKNQTPHAPAAVEPATAEPISPWQKLQQALRFEHIRTTYEAFVSEVVDLRHGLVPIYFVACLAILWVAGQKLGREIFPTVDAGQFRLRMRAPDGTHFAKTERLALDVLKLIENEVGARNLALSLGYVGTIPSSYPINAVFQWSRGPEEAILYIELREHSGIKVAALQERLRARLREEMPGLRCSFEASDIVNQVMSFGSPTPIEVSVHGPNFAENRAFAEKVRHELAQLPALRDLEYVQSLDYPTIEVEVDRQRAGMAGLTPVDVSRALTAATSSSRFITPNFWADPKSGIGYQVQVELPRPVVRQQDGVKNVASMDDLGSVPLRRDGAGQVLVRDVATLQRGTMPGQFDRYNMRRQVSLTANILQADLGHVVDQVTAAVARAGEPPKGAKVDIRGQAPPMQELSSGLSVGLMVSIAVVFLLLAANFQSIRLALATVSTAPAVIVGVALMLLLSGARLNIQSFIGAIMAVGVATANAILLVTFAEESRRQGNAATKAAVLGASGRLRAILMTSCAMIAGMVPMALGLGEAGQQNAPLGLAVIGGLAGATLATLFVLPSVFALVQEWAKPGSPSLDPDDPESAHFAPR